MASPVTLFTGQWGDLPFEEVCRLAREMGFDGLEIACWGDHMEVAKAASDRSQKAVHCAFSASCRFVPAIGFSNYSTRQQFLKSSLSIKKF